MASLEDRIDDEKRAEGLASDANTMVEKPDIEAEITDTEAERTDVEGDNNSGNAAAVLPEDTLSADDYPKGLQFFFILLALILSIFMVALDLVCSCLPRFLSSDT
jgi:MFS transporter, DHA2 family, glioxin efflux transporter